MITHENFLITVNYLFELYLACHKIITNRIKVPLEKFEGHQGKLVGRFQH